MPTIRLKRVMVLTFLCMLALSVVGALAAETPKRGGILTFMVASYPPGFDGHREYTFAMLQPTRPFYSVLIRVNPENPSSPNDFVGDLALGVPEPTEGGKKYSFRLRKNARFWDGQPVTARDVVASFNKIIFPPPGIVSARKAFYSMVEKVYAEGEHTVTFALKYPSSAFIPALANPYNYIYNGEKLAKDMHWYEKNILGSGPFIFTQGKPYLDGFRAIFDNQQSRRVEAIRKNQAMIEFRGFPPRSRDILKRALGDQITVQESDWSSYLLVVPNHLVKPFDDPRVRRALTLAIDRWGGSGHLSRIAIVKAVGGTVFPGHPLAATREELQKIAGYWPDLEKSRAEARRLLREAGVPDGFSFRFHMRPVDQPYKIVGHWLINQWRTIGLNAEMWVQPTKPFFKTLRSGGPDFEVSIDWHTSAVVNPILDISKFISNDRSDFNFANYKDRVLDDIADKMDRTADVAEQRRLMRQFEKRALDEQAHMLVTHWWYRIIPHRSIVRGWKVSPSHYIPQDLANVWLAE